MIQIPAALIEFVDGGNTIWVHSPNGATILRIKTMGKIKVTGEGECENVCSHSDMVVQEDIEICLADDAIGQMPPQYEIGEKIQIPISRTNGEPNFDKACESAYRYALMRFGCDDCGHLNNVKNSHRSENGIVVEFKNYRHYGGMGGQTCEYIFEAWVDKPEEEYDEDDE